MQIFTILTPPNGPNGAIHKGCPILGRQEWPMWLGGRVATADQLVGILRVFLIGMMDAYPVGRRVGNARNNDTALLDEISIAA